MWWSRPLCAALLLALAGCGYSPALAPGGGGARLAGEVRMEAPENRAEFLLVQAFEEETGLPQAPAWRVDYDLSIEEDGLAITADQTITRFNLLGRLDWRLVGADGSAPAASGRVENFTGYSATGSTVATLAARRDAEARLMRILARSLADRLALELAP